MAHENIKNRVSLINSFLFAEGAEFKVEYDLRYKDGKVRSCFVLRNEEINVSPTVYPDEGIDNLTDEQVAQHLIEIYKDTKVQSIDPDRFLNRDYIEKYVLPRARREDEEQDIYEFAHFAFVKELNLLYTYYVPAFINGEEKGSITLTWDHIASIGLSLEDLRIRADFNAFHFMKIDTLYSKIKSMLEGLDIMDELYTPVMDEIYVLTTADGIFGAGLISSHTVLNHFRVLHGDFVILPSSIHELLLIPVNSPGFISDAESFETMVREVNSTEVSEEERLSDTPYFFRGKGLEYLTDELLGN